MSAPQSSLLPPLQEPVLPVGLRIKRLLGDVLWRALAQTRSFEPTQAMLIFSEGRGGSTWLTDLLARLPRRAVLWEPLYPLRVPAARQLGFRWWPQIDEQRSAPELRAFFQALLGGRVLNSWIGSYSGFVGMLRAQQLIVKFCLGKPLLPWLTREFAFRYPPLLLLRHPFAVAASQWRHGAWDTARRQFYIPPPPLDALYRPHREYLLGLSEPEEILVATWCLNNLVPLRHARHGESWLPVYYEELLARPQQAMQRVFERWQLPCPDDLLGNLRQASKTTHDARFHDQPLQQVSKWQQQFGTAQIQRMSQVLDYFQIAEYSATDPWPSASTSA